jgi:hypothetical protein
LFLICAILMTLAGQFLSTPSSLGGDFIVYSLLVFYAHLTILSGRIDLGSRNPTSPAQRRPSLRFFGLVFVVMWLPPVIGAVVGLVIMPSLASSGSLFLAVCVAGPLLVSLSFFGVLIPRFIWIDLTRDETVKQSKGQPVWAYVATRLLLWNGAFLVVSTTVWLVFVMIIAVVPGIRSIYFDIAMSVVIGTIAYCGVALIAAVLSHAHLKAYDLGPQGLVHRL